MMMLDLDPKQKKRKGAEYFTLASEGLDEEWVKAHQEELVDAEKVKIEKKFAKDNEKRKAEKERPLPEKELKERLGAADELAAKFKRENKSKKVEAEGKGVSVEKLEADIAKIDARIHDLELQATTKDENKEIALGTSKIVSVTASLEPSLPVRDLTLCPFPSRTTSTPALRSSSAASSTSLSRSSSPRRFARSLCGRSIPLRTTTGSSEGPEEARPTPSYQARTNTSGRRGLAVEKCPGSHSGGKKTTPPNSLFRLVASWRCPVHRLVYTLVFPLAMARS